MNQAFTNTLKGTGNQIDLINETFINQLKDLSAMSANLDSQLKYITNNLIISFSSMISAIPEKHSIEIGKKKSNLSAATSLHVITSDFSSIKSDQHNARNDVNIGIDNLRIEIKNANND